MREEVRHECGLISRILRLGYPSHEDYRGTEHYESPYADDTKGTVLLSSLGQPRGHRANLVQTQGGHWL